MKNDYFIRFFDVEGTCIKLCSNSKTRLESMLDYLEIAECSHSSIHNIEMSLLEIDEGSIDDHIALPEHAESMEKTFIILDKPLPYCIYIDKLQRWSDIPGFGRVWHDYSTGAAKVCIYKDSCVNPQYADIVLGYNVLISLMLYSNFYSIHASCIKIGNTGVLFTGDSGKGKSTAAYALARKGYPILSDDRILIHNNDEYRAVTITDAIKLRRDSIDRFFPELLNERPQFELDGEFYYKSSLTKKFSFVPSTKVDYIITLNKTGLKNSRAEEIKPLRVIGDLFPVTLSCFEPFNMGRKFSFLTEMLNNVKCYRIDFGTDMEDFTKTVEGLVA